MPSKPTVIACGAILLTAGGGALAYDQIVRQPREQRQERAEALTAGKADHGQGLVERYGCAGCHRIPGIKQRGGGVGPPLAGIASRAYLAGKLENRPANLMLWIQDPQRIEPGTGMPDLGVTPDESRDIAAFLLTLA
jgi:cytochrome c